MAPLERLTAEDINLWIRRYSETLAAHREVIDALNVYPVPDSDTGTNMKNTLEKIVAALPGDADLRSVCEAISRGATAAGAGGGNSGSIVAEFLRAMAVHWAKPGIAASILGFARGLAGPWNRGATIGPAGLAGGLVAGANAAYGARPDALEGTMLTVGRECANAATAATAEGGSLAAVVDAALERGRVILERTPQLLGNAIQAQVSEIRALIASAEMDGAEAMRLSGDLAEKERQLADVRGAAVVDAGGRGLLLLLESLASVVEGRPLPEPSSPSTTMLGHHPHGDIALAGAGTRYEVMFLLEPTQHRAASVKDRWAGKLGRRSSREERRGAFMDRWSQVGDSIVVAGDEHLWNCHIHTDDIGGAIEAGIEAGRPYLVQVTDLHAQMAGLEPVAAPVSAETAVVAVAAGDGVRRIFEDMGQGAVEVVAGGQTMTPSVGALLVAVERAPAAEVVLLPNNKKVALAAGKVQELTDKRVVVVPTVSIPAGLDAMTRFDPNADAVSNGEEMEAVAIEVAAGKVTRAVEDAESSVGPVTMGDFVGEDDGGVVVVAKDSVEATCGLLERIVGDSHELVTLIRGAEATEADTAAVAEWLATERPHVQLETHVGGQPRCHYYIGIL